MAIRDWSQTAASNTTLEGINAAEGGMTMSSVNNTFRAMAAAIREVQASSTIASASTVNIGAANVEYLQVTGTTTITAFDSVAAGVYRVLQFAAAVTLTHNATSLILPTGANVTTAAGDLAAFRSLGSGNWRCEWYSRASGAALSGGLSLSTVAQMKTGTDTSTAATPAGVAAVAGGAWADLASAATTDLGAQNVSNIRVTGTTTITSFGTADSGVTRQLRFAGALTLTYNASSLILPGAASITTAAGDTARAVSLGGGNWIVVDYQRASGRDIAGSLIKGTAVTMSAVANTVSTATAHGLGAIPDFVTLKLVCTTADNGYAVGETVFIGGLNVIATGTTIASIFADATNMTVRITNNQLFAISSKSANTAVQITSGSWNLVATPYLMAA